MHSFFWYSSLLITDSSKVGSCRQTSTLAEPGAKACNSERHFSYSERHAAWVFIHPRRRCQLTQCKAPRMDLEPHWNNWP